MKSLTLAAVAALAAANPTFDAAEFQVVGKASADAVTEFWAALPHQNLEELEAIIARISTPGSPEYGNWMTQEEVNTLTGADPEHRADVLAYLTSTGASCMSYPTSLRCKATVAQIEKLFDAPISEFRHVARQDRRILRIHPDDANKINHPAHLAGKLLGITQLVDFPTVRMRQGRLHGHSVKNDATKNLKYEGTDFAVTLETLHNIYGVGFQTDGVRDKRATGGPAEFQNDTSYVPSDAWAFATANGVPQWNVSRIYGPFNPLGDTEAELDEQFMGGITSGSDAWYWTETGWMYEFTEHIKALPSSSLPQVFSISWGWAEDQQCWLPVVPGPCGSTNNTQAYLSTTNAGFAAAAARGITLLAASGDSGAHGRTDGECSNAFMTPIFPGSSPYVTTVGATQLVNATQAKAPVTPYCKSPGWFQPSCAQSGTEIVCSTGTGAEIVSGGGFSTVFPQPTWQRDLVQKYIASGRILATPADYNGTNRAYPDVAALGHNYQVWQGGDPGAVDGTSCATPVWAGIIQNLNAQRIQAGKPVLGYLNPLLYAVYHMNPKAFTDITVGDNRCTEDDCFLFCPHSTGYGATKGYDAVSGLGTPVFPQLAKSIAALA